MRTFTDEELAKMSLATAEIEVSNAVYEATALIERLEHAGKLCGNAHHGRQAVALVAIHEVRVRWNDREEATLRAAEHRSLTPGSLSAK